MWRIRCVFGVFAARRFEVYKAVAGAVAAAAKKWKGYPWDEATRELFTADAWQKKRVDGWSAGRPIASNHIVVHFYENGPTGYRLVSLGMQKLALPDLAIDGAPQDFGEQLMDLITLTAAELIEHAGGSLARYKLPKAVVFRSTIVRSPAGKI